MMRKVGTWMLSFLFALTLTMPGSVQAVFVRESAAEAVSPKKHDLILLHGLRNGHRWSDRFLKVVADEWDPGHVYVIYANNSNQVRTRSRR